MYRDPSAGVKWADRLSHSGSRFPASEVLRPTYRQFVAAFSVARRPPLFAFLDMLAGLIDDTVGWTADVGRTSSDRCQ